MAYANTKTLSNTFVEEENADLRLSSKSYAISTRESNEQSSIRSSKKSILRFSEAVISFKRLEQATVIT